MKRFNLDNVTNVRYHKDTNMKRFTKSINRVVSETHCIKDEIFAYREESSRRDCSVPKAVTSFW